MFSSFELQYITIAYQGSNVSIKIKSFVSLAYVPKKVNDQPRRFYNRIWYMIKAIIAILTVLIAIVIPLHTVEFTIYSLRIDNLLPR